MESRPRHWRIAILLGLLTLLLVVSGLAGRLWRAVMPVPAAWQRSLAARATDTEQESLVQLRERLVRLNAENVVLRRRLAEYEAIAGEGRVPPAQAVVARGQIVARTLRQGRRLCELDVGAVDGVEVDQPVALGWTLVGVVVGRSASRCLVREVGDSESRIPAALFNDQELLAEGVLHGIGAADEARLEFVEDRPGVNVEPGQRVVSAGLDGVPAGMVLGTVLSADRSGDQADHWRILVRLMRTPANADSLLVLRPSDAPPPPPPTVVAPTPAPGAAPAAPAADGRPGTRPAAPR